MTKRTDRLYASVIGALLLFAPAQLPAALQLAELATALHVLGLVVLVYALEVATGNGVRLAFKLEAEEQQLEAARRADRQEGASHD